MPWNERLDGFGLPPSASAAAAGMPTVLIVDDDPRFREDLADGLALRGFATAQASDGLDALDVLDRVRADVVVSDIDMPRMDGLELRDRLAASSPAPRVILVSGRQPGPPGSLFLAKPFRLAHLVALIGAAAIPG